MQGHGQWRDGGRGHSEYSTGTRCLGPVGKVMEAAATHSNRKNQTKELVELDTQSRRGWTSVKPALTLWGTKVKEAFLSLASMFKGVSARQQSQRHGPVTLADTGPCTWFHALRYYLEILQFFTRDFVFSFCIRPANY